LKSKALSDSIIKISESISKASGIEAMNYLLSSQYIKALGKLADPRKNIVIKANIDNPGEII